MIVAFDCLSCISWMSCVSCFWLHCYCSNDPELFFWHHGMGWVNMEKVVSWIYDGAWLRAELLTELIKMIVIILHIVTMGTYSPIHTLDGCSSISITSWPIWWNLSWYTVQSGFTNFVGANKKYSPRIDLHQPIWSHRQCGQCWWKGFISVTDHLWKAH